MRCVDIRHRVWAASISLNAIATPGGPVDGAFGDPLRPRASSESTGTTKGRVDRGKDQIKDSPDLTKGSTWADPTYRESVGTYYGSTYGRPGL